MARKFSIIIPVCNEPNLKESISKIKKLDKINDTQIILSSCSKEKIKDKSIKKVLSKKGRPNQLNSGAKIAKGKILIFLHLDTTLPNDALIKIEEALKSQKYTAGAFKIKFNTKNIFLKIISSLTNLRSKISKIPYGDQAIFIKRKSFEKIGGFKNVPFLEDVFLMESLKKEKLKINILNDFVITSTRKWERDGIFKRTILNRLIILGHILKIKPETLAKLYY